MLNLTKTEKQERRRKQIREAVRRNRGSNATDEKQNEVEKFDKILARYYSTFQQITNEVNAAYARFWAKRGVDVRKKNPFAYLNSRNNKKRENVFCETPCGA